MPGECFTKYFILGQRETEAVHGLTDLAKGPAKDVRSAPHFRRLIYYFPS